MQTIEISDTTYKIALDHAKEKNIPVADWLEEAIANASSFDWSFTNSSLLKAEIEKSLAEPERFDLADTIAYLRKNNPAISSS